MGMRRGRYKGWRKEGDGGEGGVGSARRTEPHRARSAEVERGTGTKSVACSTAWVAADRDARAHGGGAGIRWTRRGAEVEVGRDAVEGERFHSTCGHGWRARRSRMRAESGVCAAGAADECTSDMRMRIRVNYDSVGSGCWRRAGTQRKKREGGRARGRGGRRRRGSRARNESAQREGYPPRGEGRGWVDGTDWGGSVARRVPAQTLRPVRAQMHTRPANISISARKQDLRCGRAGTRMRMSGTVALQGKRPPTFPGPHAALYACESGSDEESHP
ncbi:hypothetical protein C8F04DRAFT_1290892 [Mycena alexandri]|uniref:Uncharacterized protein n=1 Tax=Mycena alexandri TaxID=1745969 RepID=A0AAD6SIU4_9AGAR|nr:hypothetical protein C8F04DRAFT_1290892 [Mycena alexandri]